MRLEKIFSFLKSLAGRKPTPPRQLLYGLIIIDGRQFAIPVQVGKSLPEIIIGVKWLKLFNLVVNYPNILTLEYKG